MIMNKPKVNKIAGSDRITTKGFNMALIMEKIKPANKKPMVPMLTCILSDPVPRTATEAHNPTELINHLIIKIK
jgi:hypothetical protein